MTLALGHERSGLPSGLFLVGGQCRLVGSVISIRFRHHAITHFLHTGSLRGMQSINIRIPARSAAGHRAQMAH